MPAHRARCRAVAAIARLAAAVAVSTAAPAAAAGGKLLLTGGVSSIDGAAGGGLTPWALTAGYATEGEAGGTAFVTRLKTGDYALTVAGVAATWNDRVEVSLARQRFDAGDNLAPLGLRGLTLAQDIVGAKLRLAGDAVLDADRGWPQLALGVLHKRSDAGALAPTLHGALGARRSGSEWYLAATKLFLAPGLLVNVTLRASRANQNGLLGFGGARSAATRVLPELSLAWLLRRDLALGAEARRKPDHLHDSVLGRGALQEDDAFDVFVAWAPDKGFSLTAAWVDLGRIAPGVQPRRQRGAYLSAQLAF